MKSLTQYINEAKGARKDVFTIDIFNVSQDEGIDDMQYAKTYYDEDEAIEDAIACAKSYADDDDVINVSVMAGEYEDEKGNIFGEPDAIYVVSNKGKEETAKARKASGYVNCKVDKYVTETK